MFINAQKSGTYGVKYNHSPTQKKLNGNVRISVIANNGEVLHQKDTAYKRRIGTARHHRTRHSNKAIFSVTFESIPENSRVVAELIIVEKK